MKESSINLRNALFGGFYKFLCKPIFFAMDPEKVHDRMLVVGQMLESNPVTRGLTKVFFGYSNKMLEQNIKGIKFRNPIGLAAGFDKNAQMPRLYEACGFGHGEIGSITGEPCEGNPKPRLWRLKKSQGLVVYYGLKNKGAEVIAKKLEGKEFSVPVGVSIAKTNCKVTADKQAGIDDYVKAHRTMIDTGDYATINISCPNAHGGEPFSKPEDLDALLTAIEEVPTEKPIFIKLAPDHTHDEIDSIIEVADRHKIAGFVCTNLTKDRKNESIMKKVIDSDVPDKGGISGMPVRDLSTEVVSHIYKKAGEKYVIMGCGGVFSAKDAYEKIKAGASLIQMITGMIFVGPQLMSDINRGLVKLLKQDGLANISDAVGLNHKKS